MYRQKYTVNMDYPTSYDVPNWTTRDRPIKSTMVGAFCKLEPLDLCQHADELYRALCERDTDHNWFYLPYGPFQNQTEFNAWLKELPASDDPLFHAIIDKANNKVAGIASYLRIAPIEGSIEVGHIHFGHAIQRTPVATEAMYLMMRRVFDELGYRRYEWKCDALNARSRSAALRLGFSFEGIFRQATVVKGRNRDTAWFSIIDSEWAAIKATFENWLAAENFDEKGQQRQPLSIKRP